MSSRTANAFLPSDRHYHLELFTSSARGTIQGMYGLQFAGARHYSTVEGEIDTLLKSESRLPSMSRISVWKPFGESSKVPTAD